MTTQPVFSYAKQSIILIMLLLTIPTTPAHATAGDEHWSSDFYRQGITGQTNALLSFNNLLVLGGDITTAGPLPVQNIATWNGQHWGTLGSGINGEITTLVEHKGNLIAAGEFSEAGGVPASNIARWDGSVWHPLNSGSGGRIENLFVYAGQLIALGDFSSTLGSPGAKIASWDGSNWATLGSGPDLGENEDLYAVTAHDGSLIVAGETDYFPLAGPMVWDGNEWTSPYPYPGNQMDAWYPDFGHISVLHVYQGELVAGGHFSYYDEDTGDNFSAICRWDGASWIGLESGLWAPTPIESNAADVMSLLEYDGNLLVGGIFWEGIPALANSSVCLWNGSAWQSMASGLFGANGWSESTVTDMVVWNNQILAGGSFQLTGELPQREAHNIAAWENTQWHPVGPTGSGLNGKVMATLEFGEQLLAAGSWRNIDGTYSHLAGIGSGVSEVWEALGGDPNNTVNAMVLFEDRLIIGGAFSMVGEEPALHVAAFDGMTWQAFGSGVPDVVEALSVYEGELYAGPYRWDGAVWINELQINGPVKTLQVWNGDLYAGGIFGTAGGVEAAGIAGWNGVECFSLGAGVTHPMGTPMSVYAMTIYESDLIAGGNFYLAGGSWTGHLARWDGQQWSAVSDSIASAGSQYGIYSLASHENQLFAGGRFIHQGMELNGLGRWDGSSWHALGSGIGGENVHSLMVMEGALWVGGEFEMAGNKPAFSMGRWADPAVLDAPSGVFDQVPVSALGLNIYPNPFNPRTQINFSLDHSGLVDLAVYNLRGRKVAVLEYQNMSAGNHVVFWNGADDHGRAVPSGAYFVRLGIESGVKVKKIMLIR